MRLVPDGVFHWRHEIAQAGPDTSSIEVAFTERSPGVGQPPWAGLNLGGHVGDDPAQVEANRTRVAQAVGVDRDHLVLLNQVHGAEVVEVDGPSPGRAPDADAVVTCSTGLALVVLVADCVPVLLHDARAGVIAAAHAGRAGLTAGIVPATVARMRGLGARQISAVVGPSVCGRCYEVPSELARQAAAVAPSSLARSWVGTPAIDVATGVVEQLSRTGIRVDWVRGCTREDPLLYSYRRDGRTGRFAGVIVRRAGRSGRAATR